MVAEDELVDGACVFVFEEPPDLVLREDRVVGASTGSAWRLYVAVLRHGVITGGRGLASPPRWLGCYMDRRLGPLALGCRGDVLPAEIGRVQVQVFAQRPPDVGVGLVAVDDLAHLGAMETGFGGEVPQGQPQDPEPGLDYPGGLHAAFSVDKMLFKVYHVKFPAFLVGQQVVSRVEFTGIIELCQEYFLVKMKIN